MSFLSKIRLSYLYIFWGGLFVLTAALGLAFPYASSSLGRVFLGLISGVFFLPPWLILAKARQKGDRRQIRIIRYLAMTSLGAAMVLICAGILSASGNQAWGNALHVMLTVVCAPLVCSNFYVLPLFGWATLLVGSFRRIS